MASSGREGSYTRACLSCDDVHELHLGLQHHSTPTPLPCLREGVSTKHKHIHTCMLCAVLCAECVDFAPSCYTDSVPELFQKPLPSEVPEGPHG